MIQDNEPALRIHRDSVDAVELSGSPSFDAADDLAELSIFIELHDAVVLITVGDEDVAIGRNVNIACAIERGFRGVVALHALRSNRHQQLSVDRELVHHLAVSVADPDKTE